MKNVVAVVTALLAAAWLAACSEPPPRSVLEYVEDPVLMEATLARCRHEGASSRDDISCANARRAADRVAAERESARRALLEAESERRRDERRRQQQAIEEAQRQAEEARRRAEQEAYDSSWSPLQTQGAAPPDSASLPQPAVEGVTTD